MDLETVSRSDWKEGLKMSPSCLWSEVEKIMRNSKEIRALNKLLLFGGRKWIR
jgi:hypothetical protein